jgi:hypothetical protein
MDLIYVQFSDASETKVIGYFCSGDNDPKVWPNQGEVTAADPRWKTYINSQTAFLQSMLPPPVA